MLYSGFNILPRSVFWSADFNGRSDNLDVIHLKARLLNFRLKTLFAVMTIAAIATAWFVDVNRRNAPRFLHLYLLARVERFEHVPYKSVEIRPNIPFAFGHVPENSFSGKMEYKLGSLPLLEFHTCLLYTSPSPRDRG